VQGLVEVRDDVVHILQSHWKSDKVVSDSYSIPFLNRDGSMA